MEELWNLSDLTAECLRELGITSYAEFEAADLCAVWQELKPRHKQVTKLMYYALWGAKHNCHWQLLEPQAKAALTTYLDGQT